MRLTQVRKIPDQIQQIFVLLVLACQFACLSSSPQSSKKVFLTGVNILYGPVKQADLFSEFPAWKENYETYQPDSLLIDSLSMLAGKGLKTEIFFGTWCGDSRREVPHFLKIAEQGKLFPADSIFLWGVDRNKELDNGLTENRNIKRVATFIVFRNGREIGRIVESPQSDSLERDLLNIFEQRTRTDG